MAFLGLGFEPYPFSKRTPVRFDGGKGQLDIVELATCFLELSDEAALGTLPLSSLVYITRTEIGFFGTFTFFWSTESISYWGSCGWSCHPLSRRTCLSHRRQPWQPLGESPVGIDLRYPTMAIEIYTYFVTKSKHSASFPSFLSCIEFRFRRTA